MVSGAVAADAPASSARGLVLAGVAGLALGVAIAEPLRRLALRLWARAHPGEEEGGVSGGIDAHEDDRAGHQGDVGPRPPAVSVPDITLLPESTEADGTPRSSTVRTPPRSDGPGSNAGSFRRVSSVRHVPSVPFHLEAYAHGGSSFSYPRTSSYHSGLVYRASEEEPMSATMMSATPVGACRGRLEGISSSQHSEGSAGLAFPHVELATDNARRMLSSTREEFRSPATVLYIASQVTSEDAVSQVARVLTPHDKLKGAMHKVLGRIKQRNASRDLGERTASDASGVGEGSAEGGGAAMMRPVVSYAPAVPGARDAGGIGGARANSSHDGEGGSGGGEHAGGVMHRNGSGDKADGDGVSPAAACGAMAMAANPEFLFIERKVPVPRSVIATPGAALCLTRGALSRWDWDVFELHAATNGHSLIALGDHLLAPVCDRLGIPRARLYHLLSELEGSYRSDVTYHTSAHAADVLQSAWWMLEHGKVFPALTRSDLLDLALLLAAAAHDAGHPGVNTDFLVRSSHPLALLYNDRSVLENMHSALCFRLLALAENDMLASLEPEERTQVRDWMTHSILCTDMKGHYQLMASAGDMEPWTDSLGASSRTASHEGETGPEANLQCARLMSDDDVSFALGLALHAADLGGPIKPSTVVQWSRRVAEEFFRQGEAERRLGLEVTPGFDRSCAEQLWPERNAAFVDFVVKPLFQALQQCAPDSDLSPCLDGAAESMEKLVGADWRTAIHEVVPGESIGGNATSANAQS